MARPNKLGLDYFPKDTDCFSDRKIRRLIKEYGSKGYMIFDCLLCEVYKNGYFVEYDGELAFDIADRLGDGITENLVIEVINGCFRMGLFSEAVFKVSNKLTSSGIQRRYVLAKRNGIIDEKMRVSAVETRVIAAESTQSKEKESKEKESKEKKRREGTSPPTHEEVLTFSLSKSYDLKEINKFYAHYTANGWVQGKSKAPIKNWKAALAGWMLRCDDFKPEKKETNTVYKRPEPIANGPKY